MRILRSVPYLLTAALVGCSPLLVECPEGSYRCGPVCMRFGTYCGDAGEANDSGTGTSGAIDAGAGDSGSGDPGSTDSGGIRSDAGACTAADGLPVRATCSSSTGYRVCESGLEWVCPLGQHCEEYVANEGDAHAAACFDDGAHPCNSIVETERSCMGSFMYSCGERQWDVGQTRLDDCRGRLGWSDAVCVPRGDSVGCAAPEATPCDSPSARHCADGQLLECSSGYTDGYVWHLRECEPDPACFESRIDGRAICIGADARPIESTAERRIGCADSHTIIVEADGYRYSSACPITYGIGDGMITSTTQHVCVVDDEGQYSCMHPRNVTPCVPGTAPVCGVVPHVGDASMHCVDQGDGRFLTVPSYCAIRDDAHDAYVPTPCADGACRNIGDCTIDEPSLCDRGNAVYCDSSTLQWTLGRCGAGCLDGLCPDGYVVPFP